MKKKLLVLPLLILPMLAASCTSQLYTPSAKYPGIPDYPTPGGGGGEGEDPDLPTEFNMIVNFYLNYSNSDTPYYTMEWYSLVPLGAMPVDAAITDSQAPDPLYPHFIGYSQYPSAINESKLWNFEESTYSSNVLSLYGIWVKE